MGTRVHETSKHTRTRFRVCVRLLKHNKLIGLLLAQVVPAIVRAVVDLAILNHELGVQQICSLKVL